MVVVVVVGVIILGVLLVSFSSSLFMCVVLLR